MRTCVVARNCVIKLTDVATDVASESCVLQRTTVVQRTAAKGKPTVQVVLEKHVTRIPKILMLGNIFPLVLYCHAR